ncbi:MAG: hypothetical protein HC915_07580 [Anaerolineae bacterium]|nr:hypothetical protein [Anaerolineae bacterium]
MIQQGATVNELRIVAQDNQFRFYINQQIAPLCTRGDNRQAMVNPLNGACVTNEWQENYQDSRFRQGRIGLAVGTTQGTDLSTPVVVGFDNIVIIGPE